MRSASYFLRMKLWQICLCVFIFSGCAHSPESAIVENDESPFFDPHFATASLMSLSPKNDKFSLSLKKFDVSFLKKSSKLRVWHWQQTDSSAPLFILLPGFGGDPSSPVSNATALNLWKQGFQVLSFASVTHPQGQRTILNGKLPGIVSEDNDSWLSKTEKLLVQLNLDSKPVHIIGVSWGALQVLEIASSIERETYQIQWGALIALNPPLDLSYTLVQLDSAYRRNQKRFAPAHILSSRLRSKVDAANSSRLNLPEKLSLFEKDEVEFLIAWSFRDSLLQITGQSQNSDLSFSKYIRQSWGLNLSTQAKIQKWENSQKALNWSENWPSSLLVFHSLDDYLNRPKDLISLKQSLGNKMLLYRHGGHLGSLHGTRVWSDIKRSLSPLLK